MTRAAFNQRKKRTLMMVLPQHYKAPIKGREVEWSRVTGVEVVLTLKGRVRTIDWFA